MPWRLQFLPEYSEDWPYIQGKDTDLTGEEIEAVLVAIANAARISYRGEESIFFIVHDKITKRVKELANGDTNYS